MPVYENDWAMELGKVPSADLSRQEHAQNVKAVQNYADLNIIPFPPELDTDKLYKHDAVFVRDSFISNQKGKIVMSNFSAKERQPEADQLQKYLKEQGFTVYTLPSDAHVEGGEFYYVNKGNILFAGVSRNNRKGVEETAKLLNIDELCIVASDSYHLDTIFTALLNKKGELVGIVICMELVNNQSDVKKFAAKHTIPILAINPHDAIDFNGKGDIAVNCLPLPGVIIGGGLFQTPGVEAGIKQLGIEHVIAPNTQFHLSGGGTHCLTNELSI